MANKETMIVFVYDTECVKEESDDPVNAVLYFHPSWVSDTQKVALCGQLMGTSYFLKDCFFKPKIIALQNGKFVLKEFERFILAVGTDRNISDYLLEQRADLLASLVRFFHRDLQSIYDQFSHTQKNLSDKLYHIFETYLPILQQNGNIFHNIPKLRIPKTASNIFLDAIQMLQCCQQTRGVLGGVILYHNKVVATQLSDAITKQLLLTNPMHIRTTAEQLNSTDFHIPNGVQMIVVYVEQQIIQKLIVDAQRAQNLQTMQLSQGILPNFSYNKRKMKRDKSLIFTNIPEEGHVGTASDKEVDCIQTAAATIQMRPKTMTRPTHLPLRLKNSKELPESGIASINFDENDSYPEFIGRTSVCSTPMAENKVLQVGNIMSICANPEEEDESAPHKLQRRNSLKLDIERFFQHFIANPNKPLTERRNSLTDLHNSFKKFSKKLSLRQFSQKTDTNRNSGERIADKSKSNAETSDFIENDGDDDDDDDDDNSAIEGIVVGEEEHSDNSDEINCTSYTITDPTYPMFNANGQPISHSLFQEFLEKYYKLWDSSIDANKDEEIAQLIEQFKQFNCELQQLDSELRQSRRDESKIDGNLNAANTQQAEGKTQLDKRALSLPLKPLADATPSTNDGPSVAQQPRRPLGGVPLTPLMAKLSVLALGEERGGMTPGVIDIQTPLNASKSFARRSSAVKYEDAIDALTTNLASTSSGVSVSAVNGAGDGLQRVELYMCGQQNMTLLLLMEQNSASQQAIVQQMFDICVAKFPHMETLLNQTLNVNVEGDKRDGGYSFMCIDSQWDAVQRNGPWNPAELNVLESMHRHLQHGDGGTVTDLILRLYDTVFYGYKCGRAEFFYKEPAHQISGIPPPSDPMGNIAMRAKLRLERDHLYNLF